MELFSALHADWKANRNNTKGKLLVTCFRLAHFFASRPTLLRLPGLPWLVFYKLIIQWVLGFEVSEHAHIGPGLVIYHGQGLVVGGDVRIGSSCVLRHQTTLGNAREGGGSPVIGDRVKIGAHVCILGEITIGDGARIGAGSVVVKSVPCGALAVGNPAHTVRQSRLFELSEA